MGKRVRQVSILSPGLFKLYAESSREMPSQAIIKIAESEEELKNLLMRVKEESEKAGLKHNSKKTKTMASDAITSWQIKGEKVEAVTDFIFLCSKLTAAADTVI